MSRVKLPHRLGDEFDGEPPLVRIHVKKALGSWAQRTHRTFGISTIEFLANAGISYNAKHGPRLFFGPDADLKAMRDTAAMLRRERAAERERGDA